MLVEISLLLYNIVIQPIFFFNPPNLFPPVFRFSYYGSLAISAFPSTRTSLLEHSRGIRNKIEKDIIRNLRLQCTLSVFELHNPLTISRRCATLSMNRALPSARSTSSRLVTIVLHSRLRQFHQ